MVLELVRGCGREVHGGWQWAVCDIKIYAGYFVYSYIYTYFYFLVLCLNIHIGKQSTKYLLLSDVDECLRNPCYHGGTCSNTAGSFTCLCEIGWTGPTCLIGEN